MDKLLKRTVLYLVLVIIIYYVHINVDRTSNKNPNSNKLKLSNNSTNNLDKINKKKNNNLNNNLKDNDEINMQMLIIIQGLENNIRDIEKFQTVSAAGLEFPTIEGETETETGKINMNDIGQTRIIGEPSDQSALDNPVKTQQILDTPQQTIFNDWNSFFNHQSDNPRLNINNLETKQKEILDLYTANNEINIDNIIKNNDNVKLMLEKMNFFLEKNLNKVLYKTNNIYEDRNQKKQQMAEFPLRE